MPVQTVDTPESQVEVELHAEVARQAKGQKSWAEVARSSGLQPTSISQLVAGKVRLADVRLGTLAKLCVALGLELSELVSIEATPKTSRVRTDRLITAEEFAEAIQVILQSPPPGDWTGPSREDLAELPASQFIGRLRRNRAALEKPAESNR